MVVSEYEEGAGRRCCCTCKGAERSLFIRVFLFFSPLIVHHEIEPLTTRLETIDY